MVATTATIHARLMATATIDRVAMPVVQAARPMVADQIAK
jgi:hypothetical protein